MYQASFSYRLRRLLAIIICSTLWLNLTSCDPSGKDVINDNYTIEVVSAPKGDIPLTTPTEVVLGIKNFESKLQNLYFDFPSSNISISQGGANVVPGQKTPVNLESSAMVSFTVTGVKAGTHTIKVRSENGSVSSSCEVQLSMSERVYRVDILNEQVFRVGEQRALNLRVVDMQDTNHVFYTTPGYKISARSLSNQPAMIWLGVDLIWDNFTGTTIDESQPIQWANNESVALYKGFAIGEQQVEFTVSDPKGYTSRSVYTLTVDSSRVELLTKNAAPAQVNVADTWKVAYDVDYLRHPNNKLSCKWERLPSSDPYAYPPRLFMDSHLDPKEGEWQEYKYSMVIGCDAFPIAPSIGGSKQGFIMHVKDLWGWDTTLVYRFDVTSSDFTVSLEPSSDKYIQNNLSSVDLKISNYPKGMTYKYKLVPINNAMKLWDMEYSYGGESDKWYSVDLSGADGTPFIKPINLSYSFVNGSNVGTLMAVVVDKFGTEHTANFEREFVPNELSCVITPKLSNLVVGDPVHGSVTYNLNLSLVKEDPRAYSRTEITIQNADPTATVEVDGKIVPYDELAYGFVATTTTSSPKIKYTPHRAGTYNDIRIVAALWSGGWTSATSKINVIDNFGAFSANVDQADYFIPYADPRVYQDITVTLASGKEPQGVYDWDAAYQTGTSVKYEGTGSFGRLAYLGVGDPTEITRGGTMALKGAIGNTFKLRYYPAAVNNGSYERAKLTFTRKDGATAVVNFTIEAEDLGFEVKIDWKGDSKVGEISHTANFIKVTSQSKYYKSGYQLKNYEYNHDGNNTGEALLENTKPEIGFLYIKHTATVAGAALLHKVTVADENGVEISAQNDTKTYRIIP